MNSIISGLNRLRAAPIHGNTQGGWATSAAAPIGGWGRREGGKGQERLEGLLNKGKNQIKWESYYCGHNYANSCN